MKRILMAIVAVLTLATANITMAEDVYYWKDPILTTTGEDTFRVYKAQVNTEEDRRLLEEDKQKLRKIITYYKNINAAMKEHNMKPSAGAKYYDDMFAKFQKIWYESKKKNRYDKEFVTLFREIAKITTEYYLSVYDELKTEEAKDVLNARTQILNSSAILKFVTDHPDYYK